jgi:HSP20 family protein
MAFFDRRKRKRWSPWDNFFDEFDRMEEMMNDMFENSWRDFEKLEKEGKVERYGPYVYGFSMNIGPDGKPVIKEFGNVKPDMKGRPSFQDSREPLADVFDEKDKVKVLAELPGVEKKDIELNAVGDTLTISTTDKKYYKEVELPVEIDSAKVKASYKNGVLEVMMDKKEKPKEKKRIRID